MTSVPVIDIAPFLGGTPEGKRDVADQVRRACEEIGFFLIKGHGVDQQMIDATYQSAADFFQLPLEEKLKIRQPSTEIARGYTPFKGENLSSGMGAAGGADLKEILDFGPMTVPQDDYHKGGEAGGFFHDNIFPERPETFRADMTAYYKRMNALADDLMRIFANALDLPEDFFTDKLDRNISALRVICYPEQHETPEPGQLRGGAHTDYGTLTILMSDRSAGGLQARHRDGYWVDVTIEPGTYVINLGDLMQIWTNDRWVSTLHRVVNPPAELAETSRRHSVVFFHQPNYDAVITALPNRGQEDATPNYAPVTYKDHWTGKWNASRGKM
ncbi:isopenicillin N synthase family dioxygenase [Pseudooceanicola algae]|nr:isopenicillin N synthase family oxygenase [Pseudooceanicola algae]